MTSAPPSCRNCGGTEFFSKEVNPNGHYGPELLPLGIWSGATVLLRVCGDCGLLEWFVPHRHLPKVKARFAPAASNASPNQPYTFPDSDVAGTAWADNPNHTLG